MFIIIEKHSVFAFVWLFEGEFVTLIQMPNSFCWIEKERNFVFVFWQMVLMVFSKVILVSESESHSYRLNIGHECNTTHFKTPCDKACMISYSKAPVFFFCMLIWTESSAENTSDARFWSTYVMNSCDIFVPLNYKKKTLVFCSFVFQFWLINLK